MISGLENRFGLQKKSPTDFRSSFWLSLGGSGKYEEASPPLLTLFGINIKVSFLATLPLSSLPITMVPISLYLSTMGILNGPLFDLGIKIVTSFKSLEWNFD